MWMYAILDYKILVGTLLVCTYASRRFGKSQLKETNGHKIVNIFIHQDSKSDMVPLN